MNELPLYSVFNDLRERDLKYYKRRAVGPETYLLLCEALGQGIGLWSQVSLWGLVKAVFIKPYHSVSDESLLFEEFEKYLQSYQSQTTSETNEINKETNKTVNRNNEEINELPSGNGNTPLPFEHLITEPSQNKIELPSSQNNLTIRFEERTITLNESGLVADLDGVTASSRTFIVRGNYFPMSAREIQQNLRGARRINTQSGPINFDLTSTLIRASQTGFIDRFEQTRTPLIESNLVILLDHDGSMAAFHSLGDEIASTRQHSQDYNQQVFYFHNTPIKCVYQDKKHSQPLRIENLTNLSFDSMLVFSDAGAARNSYNLERINLTGQFLSHFRDRNLIWVNPVPRNRWKNSSAEAIAALVPMIDVSREEFTQLMHLLKHHDTCR